MTTQKASSKYSSILISSIFTLSAIAVFRFYIREDLLEKASQLHEVISVLTSNVAIALLPLVIVISLSFALNHYIRPKIHATQKNAGQRIAKYAAGLAIFLWGFASSRPSSLAQVALVQGAVALFVFISSYITLSRVLKNQRVSKFAPIFNLVILLLWGGYLGYLASKRKDYLNSPLPVQKNNQDHSSPPNIVIIGVDGMDWKITNDLLERAELPTFQSVIDRGVFAPLHTFKPVSSPLIWNTIFTGFMPEIHKNRPSVIALPFNIIYKRNHSRIPDPFQMPTVLLFRYNKKINHYPLSFSEILRRAGYSSAVLGTWEAPPLGAEGLANLDSSQFPLENLFPKDLGNEYIASEMIRLSQEINIGSDKIPDAEWSFFTNSGNTPQGLFDSVSAREDQPELMRLNRFRQVYTTDRFRYLLGKRILQEISEPFCLFIYLQGIDRMTHCYLHLYEKRQTPEAEKDIDQIVQKYYKKVDLWLKELIPILPSNTYLMIVSDHGFNLNYYNPPHPYDTGSHSFAPHGVIMVTGPDLSPRRLESVHVLDITPTILSLARVPELSSMQGRSILVEEQKYNLLLYDWWSMKPAKFNLLEHRQLDNELIEKLKALGYIR